MPKNKLNDELGRLPEYDPPSELWSHIEASLDGLETKSIIPKDSGGNKEDKRIQGKSTLELCHSILEALRNGAVRSIGALQAFSPLLQSLRQA
jgi:hypothetical protein